MVVDALIDMYAKSGSVEKPQQLIDNMQGVNTVSWIAMFAGYARNKYSILNIVSWIATISRYAPMGFFDGRTENAHKMQSRGTQPFKDMRSILPVHATIRRSYGQDATCHEDATSTIIGI